MPSAGPGDSEADPRLRHLAARADDAIDLSSRPIDRIARGNDASHFLMTPGAIATPRDVEAVGRLINAAHTTGLGLTFRSGGTSLSGQAVTDQVLVDVRRHFRDVEVMDDGRRLRAQPGVTVAHANALLLRHGRMLGPDPASDAACTIGGVVANNSSGMSCGTTANTYNTLDSMVLILPSGTIIDTSAPDADERLHHLEPDIHQGLAELRDRVRMNSASVRRLRQQFSMKNTMGYGLNAFLDFDQPVRILEHLVVGSEGTLAFVASAVFRSVPRLAHAATGLLVFENVFEACAALPDLTETGARSIELMDATALKTSQRLDNAPPELMRVDVDDHAALLIEYAADTAEQLTSASDLAKSNISHLVPGGMEDLATVPASRAALWAVRKGLYAAVAEARPAGTTALLEDVVVPVEALAATTRELANLFESHGYVGSVIFGHAKDGNLHFMLTDDFADPANLDRYESFTEGMVDLILSAGGSLKAEHGTGRVMAPFVRRQYGDELYDVMCAVKSLIDPHMIMNPGVLINGDPRVHLEHIKTSVPVEAEVDRCVECGFCEPVCPSRDLTLTPRQRIVVRRAMEHARSRGDVSLFDSLQEDFDYEALHTCAVDGLCQTACPVHINTGDLVKRLRRESSTPLEAKAWNSAARHWEGATRGASLALSVVRRLPPTAVRATNARVRTWIGEDSLPAWSSELPGGGKRRARASDESPVIAYLPACVNAMFGPEGGSSGVEDSFLELCRAAGLAVAIPSDVDALCCGTPWSSKGHAEGHETMMDRLVPAVLRVTDGGRLPLVCDASSCTEGLTEALKRAHGNGHPEVRVVDVVELVAREVVPRLPEHPRLSSVDLHPTCSSTRLGLNDDLRAVAEAVAVDVRVPSEWGCCGFAGDRGMLHPELTASATDRQAAQVRASGADGQASCNRTCELGMTRATGRPYRHVVELLAELMR